MESNHLFFQFLLVSLSHGLHIQLPHLHPLSGATSLVLRSSNMIHVCSSMTPCCRDWKDTNVGGEDIESWIWKDYDKKKRM